MPPPPINFYSHHHNILTNHINKTLLFSSSKKNNATLISSLYHQLSRDLHRNGQLLYEAYCLEMAARYCVTTSISSGSSSTSSSTAAAAAGLFESSSSAATASISHEESTSKAMHLANAARIYMHIALQDLHLTHYMHSHEFIQMALRNMEESLRCLNRMREFSMCQRLCCEMAQVLELLDYYTDAIKWWMDAFVYAAAEQNQMAAASNADCSANTGGHRRHQHHRRSGSLTSIPSMTPSSPGIERRIPFPSGRHSVIQMEALNRIEHAMYKLNDTEALVDVIRWRIRVLSSSHVKQLMEAHVDLVLALLVLKAERQVQEALESCRKYAKMHELNVMRDGVIALLEDLVEACREDDLPSIRVIQEELSLAFSEQQVGFLSRIEKVYSNALFLDAVGEKGRGVEEK